MAKTNAERQRDWRDRQREKRGIVQMMPVAEHEAFKAKVRQLAEQDRAEIARLRGQLELMEQITALRGQLGDLEEKLEGSARPAGRGCPSCGGQLACPDCTRGDYYD